jgi:hypothetical protein
MHLPPEIMRTASLLVDVYGEMAVAGAFIRADELGARGDAQGHDRWLQVARAAEDLLSVERPTGIALN